MSPVDDVPQNDKDTYFPRLSTRPYVTVLKQAGFTGNSYSLGGIHSTRISGNFGLKLNGSVLSNRKSVEKHRPTFRGGPLFSVGPVRSKLIVRFHHSDPFSIPAVRRCSVFSMNYMEENT